MKRFYHPWIRPSLAPSCLLAMLFTASISAQSERSIQSSSLSDKLHGYWIGQIVGNYLGFPFENLYDEEPIPVAVDRYLDFNDAEKLGLRMNINDRRAYVPILADALGGAWSDDDTDIEFVTLHAIEAHGLDLEYPELVEMWKLHINRFIWSSARLARELMDEGYLPPQTGSRELNSRWYGISSQLMTEIWGALYPGMTQKASERGLWNARVMSDGWATHPDIVYTSMYSAAFFETDVSALVDHALEKLPSDSPFRRGILELQSWRREGLEWREARQRLRDGYYHQVDDFEVPYPMAGSIINGLCGIMALLYGDGDFTRTLSIAVEAGFDCDNQAATLGGLLGIMHGASAIPERYTHELPSRGRWSQPFNDTYINYSRDGLPNYTKISDIVDRLLAIAETAILENGGSKSEVNGEWVYQVATDLD